MKCKDAFLMIACILAASAPALTVTDVSAAVRNPWEAVVDVDFTVGDTNVKNLFRAEVTAAYGDGKKRLVG